MSILKLCTQKIRLMSCNPNMYRNSLRLSALMAPKIQCHSIKCFMLHFWELNLSSKVEKPQLLHWEVLLFSDRILRAS